MFFAVLYWTEIELQEWTACVPEKDFPCVNVCFNDTFVVFPLIIRLCHQETKDKAFFVFGLVTKFEPLTAERAAAVCVDVDIHSRATCCLV